MKHLLDLENISGIGFVVVGAIVVKLHVVEVGHFLVLGFLDIFSNEQGL